ncbi:MAG: AI-2E family transporter, partial [Candidatus Binatia bacterium]
LLSGRIGSVVKQAFSIFPSVLSAVVSTILVLFIGLYLAIAPGLYTTGLLKLVPAHKRERAREVLRTLGHTLWRWIGGRIFLMTTNGVLTTIGLWLLGVPLALTLGLLAGLLNFIPNLGPLLAGVPAVLLALLQSPMQALSVTALYFILQSLDGYVFTPLVQRRTVALPPALTIIAQVLMGVLTGSVGLMLATPLTAAVIVLVKMLYVEDILGEAVAVPGRQ